MADIVSEIMTEIVTREGLVVERPAWRDKMAKLPLNSWPRGLQWSHNDKDHHLRHCNTGRLEQNAKRPVISSLTNVTTIDGTSVRHCKHQYNQDVAH